MKKSVRISPSKTSSFLQHFVIDRSPCVTARVRDDVGIFYKFLKIGRGGERNFRSFSYLN